jgi:hypothetical protein
MESDKRSTQVERLAVVETGARNFSFKRPDEFDHESNRGKSPEQQMLVAPSPDACVFWSTIAIPVARILRKYYVYCTSHPVLRRELIWLRKCRY